MTKSEWLRLASRISRMWPHQQLADDTVAEWFLLVADLDADRATSAVLAIAMEGDRFPPHAGQIRQKALELDQSAMTFEQAWGVVQRCVGLYGTYRQTDAEEAMTPWPEALALVDLMGGWGAVCQGGPSPEEPVDSGVWYSQARNAYLGWQAQRRADLSLAVLPGRRGDAARERLGGLQRLSLAGVKVLQGGEELA